VTRVVVAGPASWNHLILLDRLPEPVPHMQFARASRHTVGGTSAGKAVHLAALGLDTRLHTLLGDDSDGARIARTLRTTGLDVVAHRSRDTERHVNLMTGAGERVSLYVSTPSTPSPAALAAMADDLRGADIAIVDLSADGAELVARIADRTGQLWVDLHDYDGTSAFHEPYVRAADVVFMNADATDDPWALLDSCLARGPRIAVCTLGADGAIARDAGGARVRVPAARAEVVDTNGAGDAFCAGFLAAFVAASDVAAAGPARASAAGPADAAQRHDAARLDDALRAGARQAVVALGSADLHPLLAQAGPAASRS